MIQEMIVLPLTVVSNWFRSSQITSIIGTLLVLGLPRVIDLQTTVELFSAGRQQLNVCAKHNTTVSTQVNETKQRRIATWWNTEIDIKHLTIKCDIKRLKWTTRNPSKELVLSLKWLFSVNGCIQMLLGRWFKLKHQIELWTAQK